MKPLTGEYEQGFDEKARVIIPPRCRYAFADGLYMTRGLDECVWILPPATWESFSERRQGQPVTSKLGRDFDRRLYACTEAALDKQGRVVIPPGLRQWADLHVGGKVVVVGVNDRLEIWHPERWMEVWTVEDKFFDTGQTDLNV